MILPAAPTRPHHGGPGSGGVQRRAVHNHPHHSHHTLIIHHSHHTYHTGAGGAEEGPPKVQGGLGSEGSQWPGEEEEEEDPAGSAHRQRAHWSAPPAPPDIHRGPTSLPTELRLGVGQFNPTSDPGPLTHHTARHEPGRLRGEPALGGPRPAACSLHQPCPTFLLASSRLAAASSSTSFTRLSMLSNRCDRRQHEVGAAGLG